MSKRPAPASARQNAPDPASLPATLPPADDIGELRGELQRQLGSLPKGQREQVLERVITVVQQHEAFRGPVPHPRHVEHYEHILPGAADRLFKMAEKEQDARISTLQQYQKDETADRRRGMNYGFTGFVLLVIGAVACGYLNQPWLGAVFLAASAVSGIGLFIQGRQNASNGK